MIKRQSKDSLLIDKANNIYQSLPHSPSAPIDFNNILQSPASNNNNKVSFSENNKKIRKCSKENLNLYAIDHMYRSKQLKKQRRQDIQKFFNESANITQKYTTSNTTTKCNSNDLKAKYNVAKLKKTIIDKKTKNQENCCKFTFIFDPNGRLSYWMSMLFKTNILKRFY